MKIISYNNDGTEGKKFQIGGNKEKYGAFKSERNVDNEFLK